MERQNQQETERADPPRGSSAQEADLAEGPTTPVSNQSMAHLFATLIDRDASASQGAGPLDEAIAAEIDCNRGGGSPIPDGLRSDLETFYQADLSPVRFHTGAKAAELSRSVQAKAFTTGTDVFFGEGVSPTSNRSRSLVAHEVAHCLQQASGTGGTPGTVSDPGEAHEVEAEALGSAFASFSPSMGPTGHEGPG